jgi:CBS domain-containing protein
MLVRDAMSTVILTIGAAVVLDPDAGGIGILTERDILNSVALGQDPDTERTHAHTTDDVVFAAPTWTLEEAARAMTHGGFRHLIVLDHHAPAGIVSVRDIIRCWAPTGPLGRGRTPSYSGLGPSQAAI